MLGKSGRRLAGVVVTPREIGSRPTTLVCLPGASYGRDYWDLQVPDFNATSDKTIESSSFSFAEYSAANGFVVVALDPLGVGSSDRPIDVPSTLEAVTAAGSDALSDLQRRLSTGTLSVGLPVVSASPIVLIGHSTGAVLTLTEQAKFGGYDAVCLLGLNFVQMEHRLASVAPQAPGETSSAGESRLRSLYGAAWNGLNTNDRMDKNLMDLDFFHGPNSDPRLRQFDVAHSVAWPARPIVEGFNTIPALRDMATTIEVPVFLGYGEGELEGLPSPHANAAWFPKSRDVTVYVAPGAYHCHNFSSSRLEMWSRICDWASSVTKELSLVKEGQP